MNSLGREDIDAALLHCMSAYGQLLQSLYVYFSVVQMIEIKGNAVRNRRMLHNFIHIKYLVEQKINLLFSGLREKNLHKHEPLIKEIKYHQIRLDQMLLKNFDVDHPLTAAQTSLSSKHVVPSSPKQAKPAAPPLLNIPALKKNKKSWATLG